MRGEVKKMRELSQKYLKHHFKYSRHFVSSKLMKNEKKIFYSKTIICFHLFSFITLFILRGVSIVRSGCIIRTLQLCLFNNLTPTKNYRTCTEKNAMRIFIIYSSKLKTRNFGIRFSSVSYTHIGGGKNKKEKKIYFFD